MIMAQKCEVGNAYGRLGAYYSPDIQISLKDFLVKLYTDEVCFAYWYLYAYIAMLMSAYFFRAMVRTMTEIHYRYMMILGSKACL